MKGPYKVKFPTCRVNQLIFKKINRFKDLQGSQALNIKLVSKELDIVLGAIDTSNSLLSWHWQRQPSIQKKTLQPTHVNGIAEATQ